MKKIESINSFIKEVDKKRNDEYNAKMLELKQEREIKEKKEREKLSELKDKLQKQGYKEIKSKSLTKGQIFIVLCIDGCCIYKVDRNTCKPCDLDGNIKTDERCRWTNIYLKYDRNVFIK